MSSLRQLREALQTELQNDLNIPFVAGKIDGPIENRDLGCAWGAGVEEVAGQVNDQTMLVNVRVFKRWNQQIDPEVPNHDPGPLEDLGEAIQAAIEDKQATLAPSAVWFCRVTGFDIDIDTNSVEARVLGYRANVST